MNSRTEKINQLQKLIRGEKPPRKVQIVLTRDESGQAVVANSRLLSENVPVNIVSTLITRHEDLEFWEAFDDSQLIDQEIKKLTANRGTIGEAMKIKTFSPQTTEIISKMYENDN